jgi:hypothetical protein
VDLAADVLNPMTKGGIQGGPLDAASLTLLDVAAVQRGIHDLDRQLVARTAWMEAGAL